MQRHECLLAFHGKLIENECEKLFSFSKKKKKKKLNKLFETNKKRVYK
jgi:hypothetical protein